MVQNNVTSIEQAKKNFQKIDEVCVNTIRTLSIDAVEKAKSGHPGMPMGMAPAAYVLWTQFLKHNPDNTQWLNRDRFILSAGHGSMLLYSLMHLTGYNISLDDIKNFRQWESKTPGHPEYGHTEGVETTTGPLGQGFANAIGMAIAQKHLAAYFNKQNFPIFDYTIFAIVSDGDLMEGISHEAASLAGHLKLGNIVFLFDDNNVTIEGNTSLACSDNIEKRFESYNWQVLSVQDGNNLETISDAINKAANNKKQPSIIKIKTKIGYGSPNKEGKASCHGSPLGEEEVVLTKKQLGWEKPEETFYVPDEVLSHIKSCIGRNVDLENEWNQLFDNYKKQYPDLASVISSNLTGIINIDIDEILSKFSSINKMATRKASGEVLNHIAKQFPFLIGGSADLAPSNNTALKNETSFSSENYSGRNIHFGIREHAMGAICNGMALSNILVPYCGTFLVFADYMRTPIRLSSLMNKRVVYVFTHDSIAVGEDGPTHQPVEHVATLRAIPGLKVIRPADATETAYAWKIAIEDRKSPTALILTRQDLPVINYKSYNTAGLLKGAYILKDSHKETPDTLLIASGSEVHLALEAREVLLEDNIDSRVVSFPCWELFDAQPEDYKESVLPSKVSKRIIIEAGISMGWEKYAGPNTKTITIESFGASAPGSTLLKRMGFTVDNIVKSVKEMF